MATFHCEETAVSQKRNSTLHKERVFLPPLPAVGHRRGLSCKTLCGFGGPHLLLEKHLTGPLLQRPQHCTWARSPTSLPIKEQVKPPHSCLGTFRRQPSFPPSDCLLLIPLLCYLFSGTFQVANVYLAAISHVSQQN